MELALRMHHLELRNRKINVELTVGGGGNSETRKLKLKEKNEKKDERQKKRIEEDKKKKSGKTSASDLSGVHPSRAALMQ